MKTNPVRNSATISKKVENLEHPFDKNGKLK